MSAAIIGLLTALPELMKLLSQMGTGLTAFWTWLNQVSGNDPSGYLVKIGVAFGQLSKAETKEDHQDAAKKIADLLHNLPHP